MTKPLKEALSQLSTGGLIAFADNLHHQFQQKLKPLVVAVSGSRYDRFGEEVCLTDHQIGWFVHILKKESCGRSIIVKHGAAKGVDQCIDEVCRSVNILQRLEPSALTIIPFPVLPSDGPRPMAGKIRNIRMIRTSQPTTDLLITFNIVPNRTGGGTNHAIEVGRKMRIPVYVWRGSANHGQLVRL